MNHFEILTMPAGRLMDALIAEKIFGIQARDGEWIYEERVPHYSTDIGDAWHILEEMNRRGPDAASDVIRYGRWVRLHEQLSESTLWTMVCLDAALAICRAALIALIDPKGGADGHNKDL